MNPQIPQIPQASQMWYFPKKKNVFSQPDDVLTAAERYMEEHGTEAFERLINKVTLVSKCFSVECEICRIFGDMSTCYCY